MSSSILHIHLISDSTGETVKSLSSACIALFPDIVVQEYKHSFVRTENKIEEILETAINDRTVILYTFVSVTLRQFIDQSCKKRNLKAISILDPLLQFFSKHLGVEPKQKAGLQHVMGEEYFKRIAAIDFTLDHDDGQNIDGLDQADAVLIGVSRTSKTPTCIYLANRGIKAANIPFVKDWGFFDQIKPLFKSEKPIFFGLIKDISHLVEIRKNRISSMNYNVSTDYVDSDMVKEEMVLAKRFFGQNGVKIIDVTHRSIEETSGEIISFLEKNSLRKDH